MQPELVTIEENGQWFVVGLEEPCGPYPTKDRAESDRRGMERFYKYKDTPGFITVCGNAAKQATE